LLEKSANSTILYQYKSVLTKLECGNQPILNKVGH